MWQHNLSLPVALPLAANRVFQRRASRHQELFAVGHTAVVFPPSHLAGVGRQIPARDVVVRADLGATQARKERFRLVRAGGLLYYRADFAHGNCPPFWFVLNRVPWSRGGVLEQVS